MTPLASVESAYYLKPGGGGGGTCPLNGPFQLTHHLRRRRVGIFEALEQHIVALAVGPGRGKDKNIKFRLKHSGNCEVFDKFGDFYPNLVNFKQSCNSDTRLTWCRSSCC